MGGYESHNTYSFNMSRAALRARKLKAVPNENIGEKGEYDFKAVPDPNADPDYGIRLQHTVKLLAENEYFLKNLPKGFWEQLLPEYREALLFSKRTKTYFWYQADFRDVLKAAKANLQAYRLINPFGFDKTYEDIDPASSPYDDDDI